MVSNRIIGVLDTPPALFETTSVFAINRCRCKLRKTGKAYICHLGERERHLIPHSLIKKIKCIGLQVQAQETYLYILIRSTKFKSLYVWRALLYVYTCIYKNLQKFKFNITLFLILLCCFCLLNRYLSGPVGDIYTLEIQALDGSSKILAVAPINITVTEYNKIDPQFLNQEYR